MTLQHVDRLTFLTCLEQCGLLEADEYRECVARLPESERGRVLARHLVEQGVLTKFQAENLLAGRVNGFKLGQYRILDEIGRGGMGRVYKAEHLTMHRQVALKVLAPHLTRTDRARQLFRREVQAAARLVHPHIVTAFDANQEGDRHYLVLEYISGPNLSLLVKELGPLPVGQACEWVRQAALGLHHAHSLGMVHRDIKPSNILVQPPVGGTLEQGGVVKITDFGLARLGSGLGRDEATIAIPANTVMGTPDFLSPEQGRDLAAADIRSDLYSLGCTLYFLLTGQVPFPGGSPLDKLVRHASIDPEPVENLRPIVPGGVCALVRRLMAKAPEQRWQTPLEVALALEPYAEEKPIRWSPREPQPLSHSTLVDLTTNAAEAASGSSSNILTGTLGMSSSTAVDLEDGHKLSLDEIRLIREAPMHKARTRLLLFLTAMALGFLLGVLLIANAWRHAAPPEPPPPQTPEPEIIKVHGHAVSPRHRS